MKKISTLLFALLSVSLAWADGDVENEEEETTTTISDSGGGIYSYVYDEDESTIIGLQLVGVKNGATSLTIPTSITVDNTSYDVVSIAEDAFSDESDCWWVSKIYVSRETPIDVQLEDSYLENFNSTPYLYVPVASIDSYVNSNWANYFPIAFTQDDYSYEVLTSDATSRTVSIIGHPSISGEYTLPSYVEVSEGTTYDVTETVAWAFQSTSMTSLTIPNSFTTLGVGTFLRNYSLTSVKFEDNSKLTTIAEQMFNECKALETVDFGGNSFEALESYAFLHCEALQKIEIPASVKSIGYEAFANCTALESVTFGENSQLEKIGEQAFISDSLLMKVAIPSSVTTIDQQAFQSCSALETVTFEENSKLTTIGKNAFNACKSLISIEIPSTVTSIVEYAFNNCTSLTNVTLPSTTTIGSSVFQYCPLESLTITGDEITTTLSPNSFNVSANSGCVLYVNEGLERSYYEAGWGVYFTINNYIEGTEIVDEENVLTYVITDQYEKTVTITGFTCSETVTIPASITYDGIEYKITAVADNVFTCDVLKEVTMEASEPPFNVSAFTGIQEGVVLNVGNNQENYKDWHGTFIIYGYVEEGDTFEVEGIRYQVLSETETVEIISATDSNITIVKSVEYNNLTFTVTQIADNAFEEQTDLTVTVEFEDPTTIILGTIASGNIGTLSVPKGYEWAFYNSAWATYFTIDGDISFTVDDFTYTLTSYGGTDVTISAYNGTSGDITIEPTVTADNDETYTIVSINEDVFTSATLSSVTVKWEDPTTVSPVGAFTEGSSVTLIVPVGFEVTYHNSDWAKYFTIDNYIEGTEIADEESGLTYEITDQYENKVTIVAFECSESVTIPETVRYSVNKETYTVTAVDANVFAFCSSLKEVTMSASTPPFEVSAFTGIPEGVVLKVGDKQSAYASWHDTFIIYGYVEAGDTFSDDVFTYTVLSDTKTVQITTLLSTAGTTFGIPTSVIYNGLDFTVASIADGVFTGKSELKVGVTFTDPSTISLGTIASGNVGTLSVPEGSERNFENSSWSTYFAIANFIEGTQFTESGITYEITDQYTYEVKIVGFTCSSSVVIPESAVGYTITAVDDNVFSCSDLVSVTMEPNTPPFSGSTFANIGENAVLYVDNISAYTTSSDNWHTYFTIYGYLEAGDTFLDDIFSYEVLSGAETVEITGIVTTGSSFTINSEVEYNGLTLTIASVDGSIFIGKSDLDVIANFKDPEAPAIDDYNGDKVGTLEVPDGYLYIFTETNWEKYFDIVGTYLLKNGVQYYFQKDGTADVVGIDTSEKIILTDRVEGFAIETIEESVFEDYLNLEVEITVVNPFSIALDEREDTSIKYGVLTVPDGCNSMYAGTVWEDYFVLDGDPYYTDGSGVYYIFHIEVVEVDEDGVEVVSLNKALKATTTEYRITLEVAYVDPDVTEITVPRTIDLGDESSSNTSYEITAMNADALKDCKDLVTINLEAAIPAEDINALNYVPDAVTIVLDEEELGTEYCESVMAAAEKVGISVKMATTGIVEVKIASDKVEVERYNLLGQRISAPQRGINIIKYSDGTVEKVLVK